MFSLKPKEPKFYELMAGGTNLVQEGAELLQFLIAHPSEYKKSKDQLENLQQRAQRINKALIDRLNRMFIAPLDREDIYWMSTISSEMLGGIYGSIEMLTLLKPQHPSPGTQTISEQLLFCTTEIASAVELLTDIKRNQHDIVEHLQNVIVRSAEMHTLYREEIARLLKVNQMAFYQWREILQYLLATSSNCDRIAKFVRVMIMKYV